MFLQHRDRNSEIILNNSRKIKLKMKFEDEEVIIASSKDEIYQEHDSNRQIDFIWVWIIVLSFCSNCARCFDFLLHSYLLLSSIFI